MAAISAARTKDTYYSAKYRRITNRRGAEVENGLRQAEDVEESPDVHPYDH